MRERAQPFNLGTGPDACLLLHGLTGGPGEVRPVGEALAAAGFRAVGPLLPGHGTTPRDLEGLTRHDLIAAAEAALFDLRDARRVFLCGLSVGGALSVILAGRGRRKQKFPQISALAVLAPAIGFSGATWVYSQLIGRLPALPLILATSRSGHVREDGSYAAVPWRWGRELRLIAEMALAQAPRVRAPALILHGARDPTTTVAGSRRLALALPGARLEVLPRSSHLLPLDVESAAVNRAVLSFFGEG